MDGCSGGTVLLREDQDFLRLSGEGSRQLKLFWASLARWGAEWNGRTFSKQQIIGMIQREDPADSESPAPMPDQGLF
jgi:hypothetical protein